MPGRPIQVALIVLSLAVMPILLAASTEPSQRVLSRTEILRAIQAALGEQGFADLQDLRAENLRLQTVVRVTQEDPGLRVMKIEFDPAQRETRFRLRASKEPRLLAFYVTTDWRPVVTAVVAKRDLRTGEAVEVTDFQVEPRVAPPELARSGVAPKDLAGQRTRHRIRAGELVTRSMFKPVALAQPGRPATLVAERPNLRISAKVMPLERGVKGQRIRIRNLATRRITTAEVVAPDLLRVTF